MAKLSALQLHLLGPSIKLQIYFFHSTLQHTLSVVVSSYVKKIVRQKLYILSKLYLIENQAKIFVTTIQIFTQLELA